MQPSALPRFFAIFLLTALGLLLLSFDAIAQAGDRPALRLTLPQAVALAVAPEGNARVQLADELIRQAQTRAAQSRAALLPNVDAYLSEQNRTLNLAASGFRFQVPIPG